MFTHCTYALTDLYIYHTYVFVFLLWSSELWLCVAVEEFHTTTKEEHTASIYANEGNMFLQYGGTYLLY